MYLFCREVIFFPQLYVACSYKLKLTVCPDVTKSLEREKERGASELNVRSGTACYALCYIMIATTLRFGLNAQEIPVHSFMMRPTFQKHFCCYFILIFFVGVCMFTFSSSVFLWLTWQESHMFPRLRPHVKVKHGIVLEKFNLRLMSQLLRRVLETQTAQIKYCCLHI